MDAQQLREALDFAVDAAREAGRVTLRYFQRNPRIDLKDDDTPVTAADREAETVLRRRIERDFPGHGIIGEEHGETPGASPGRWILDPVDGTFSFISGVPLYSTLIGLEWDGRMVVGVIHLPALDTTVCAASGLGCTFDGRPARVSSVDDLASARVSTTSHVTLERAGRASAYARVRAVCAADRGWPDAYAYALLAGGYLDVVLDPLMSLWDTAALMPVVTEAGGRLTDWSGVVTHTAHEALGTNGRLHDAVLATLRA